MKTANGDFIKDIKKTIAMAEEKFRDGQYLEIKKHEKLKAIAYRPKGKYRNKLLASIHTVIPITRR